MEECLFSKVECVMNRVINDVSSPRSERVEKERVSPSSHSQVGLGQCLHREPATICTLCKREEGYNRPPSRSGRHAKSVLPNWETDNMVESELGKKSALSRWAMPIKGTTKQNRMNRGGEIGGEIFFARFFTSFIHQF